MYIKLYISRFGEYSETIYYICFTKEKLQIFVQKPYGRMSVCVSFRLDRRMLCQIMEEKADHTLKDIHQLKTNNQNVNSNI